MLKKSFALGVLLVLAMGGFAKAGCTQEEMTQKAQSFAIAVQSMAQKDPQKAQEVAMAMQKELPELQQKATAGDIDGICKFYDDWSEKMK